MQLTTYRDRYRKHFSKTSQSRSANDSPIKERTDYYENKNISLRLMQQQGELRDNIIEQLQSQNLIPFAMLTVRPSKYLSLKGNNSVIDLAYGINVALERRYNPRHRKAWGCHHLVFFEVDKDKDDNPTWHYHIHILFCKLPIEKILNKPKLTYPVHQVIKAIYNRERIDVNTLNSPEVHKSMIEFGIRNPFDQERYGTYYTTLDFIDQKHCLKWSLVNDEKCFDGFFGWKGLVSYVTKDIFSTEQMIKYIYPKTLKKMRIKANMGVQNINKDR